jgi:hypothetical protein
LFHPRVGLVVAVHQIADCHHQIRIKQVALLIRHLDPAVAHGLAVLLCFVLGAWMLGIWSFHMPLHFAEIAPFSSGFCPSHLRFSL